MLTALYSLLESLSSEKHTLNEPVERIVYIRNSQLSTADGLLSSLLNADSKLGLIVLIG